MVSIQTFRKMALALPETSEQPHFERMAFRTKKRIYATLSEKEKTVNMKLPETEQSVFCAIDKNIIYPVPNKWGKQGWTVFQLRTINKDILQHALSIAFEGASA